MAVGGLGTRSGRLHFCGDRGFRATVSGTTRGYPGHPARWLIGRDVASVAWLRGALGVWRPPQSAAYAPRARRGREPAMKSILRYSAYIVVAAALLAQPGRHHKQTGTMAGISPGTISGISQALCLVHQPAPCVHQPGIISVPAAALRVVSGPAPCWVSAPARVVSTQQNVCTARWYQQRQVSYRPGAMSLIISGMTSITLSHRRASTTRSTPPPGPAATPSDD